MKKIKYVVTGMIIACCVSALVSGCQNKGNPSIAVTDGLDKMGNIHVVVREEGSGTRGVFAEKLNLENKSDSSHADRITDRAEVAMNAEAVIKAVSEDSNAVGFISLGTVLDEKDGIKMIQVNGIYPEGKTIESDQYPLIRNFNIAYIGKLSEGGSDFLRYILSAGQRKVEERYSKVKKPADFLSDQSKGTLKISGSSSAAPLMEQLAADYHDKYNPDLTIEVLTTDSTSGLTAAMQGSCDWGMASRELKDYEKQLLSFETIAKDGVAVIVNINNPVNNLTMDQLTQIFDGTDQKWDDVNHS